MYTNFTFTFGYNISLDNDFCHINMFVDKF